MCSSFSAYYRYAKPHIWFWSGAFIDLENAKLAVINTSGHTSGCICMYEEYNKPPLLGRPRFCARNAIGDSTVRKCWRLCALRGCAQYEKDWVTVSRLRIALADAVGRHKPRGEKRQNKAVGSEKRRHVV